jgi:uncharacterized membrane protein YphA (DoxX/SURF4 family)
VRALRIAASLLFMAAGTFKLMMASSFAQMLSALAVPLPNLVARAVPLGEVAAGAVLAVASFSAARRVPAMLVRAAAAFLALDMLAAIALVGWPGLQDRMQHGGAATIGKEPWRVPLEIALLLIALHALWRPSDSSTRKADTTAL